MSTLFKKLETTRPTYSRSTPDALIKTLDGGRQRIVFCVEMDWEALNELARKAACNKSRASRDGCLRVEVIKIEKVE